MTAPVNIVSTDGIGVRFGGIAALDGVTMVVERAKICGLVGPNGAGKTTLLRVLATALVPTSGRALVDGFDPVRRPREVRRRIGYLPDFMGLYQDMRVDEYFYFFADAHGMSSSKRRAFVERALALTGLVDRAGSFIEELSLGMRAKVAFARALAGDPALLLLDEPLSGFDPLARSDFIETLLTLRDEGTSILISSHQLEDLERLCDSVVFMNGGRIVGAGREQDAPALCYELVLGGEGGSLDELLEAEGVAGARTLSRDEHAFEVDLTEGAAPAQVLRAMVLAGFEVMVWKPRGGGLEDRLRRAVDREGRR